MIEIVLSTVFIFEVIFSLDPKVEILKPDNQILEESEYQALTNFNFLNNGLLVWYLDAVWILVHLKWPQFWTSDLVFRFQSNQAPFDDQTVLGYLNTGQVWYYDPHCILSMNSCWYFIVVLLIPIFWHQYVHTIRIYPLDITIRYAG